MIVGVTSNDYIAIGTIVPVVFVIGGEGGRRWGKKTKHRQAEENALQQLTWVVGGKPADDFNAERIPGLIEQMKDLGADHRSFQADTTAMFAKLLARAERSEESIKEATALAAKAVLDTARVAATEKDAAAAVASAELIATALAAKFALDGETPKPRTRRVATAK